MTILADSSCEAAIGTMRDNGFDQLPVLAPKTKRLIGLVTLGNILSWMSRGRATGTTEVSKLMFDFTKITEIVTDARDFSSKFSRSSEGGKKEAEHQAGGRQKFFEITLDTPLSVLNRFFEWNSAAVVTEKDESGNMKPVAVATKVDLLTWLMTGS